MNRTRALGHVSDAVAAWLERAPLYQVGLYPAEFSEADWARLEKARDELVRRLARMSNGN